jgi:hypothetical protein
VTDAPDGKCHALPPSIGLARVPASHSRALLMPAFGKLRSLNVFISTSAAYPGTSTYCRAAISKASVFPPPAAPPYMTSSTWSWSRNAACLGCGLCGIHGLRQTVLTYRLRIASSRLAGEGGEEDADGLFRRELVLVLMGDLRL